MTKVIYLQELCYRRTPDRASAKQWECKQQAAGMHSRPPRG